MMHTFRVAVVLACMHLFHLPVHCDGLVTVASCYISLCLVDLLKALHWSGHCLCNAFVARQPKNGNC